MKINNKIKLIISLSGLYYLFLINTASAINDTTNTPTTTPLISISTTTLIIASTTEKQIKYNCGTEKIFIEKIQYYKDIISKQNKDINSLNIILDKLATSTDSKIVKSVLNKNKEKLNTLYEELQSKQNDYIETASNTLSIACVSKKSIKNYNILQKNIKDLRAVEADIEEYKDLLNTFIKDETRELLEGLKSN